MAGNNLSQQLPIIVNIICTCDPFLSCRFGVCRTACVTHANAESQSVRVRCAVKWPDYRFSCRPIHIGCLFRCTCSRLTWYTPTSTLRTHVWVLCVCVCVLCTIWIRYTNPKRFDHNVFTIRALYKKKMSGPDTERLIIAHIIELFMVRSTTVGAS